MSTGLQKAMTIMFLKVAFSLQVAKKDVGMRVHIQQSRETKHGENTAEMQKLQETDSKPDTCLISLRALMETHLSFKHNFPLIERVSSSVLHGLKAPDPDELTDCQLHTSQFKSNWPRYFTVGFIIDECFCCQ